MAGKCLLFLFEKYQMSLNVPDSKLSTHLIILNPGHLANGRLANGCLANGRLANGRLANGRLANGHLANRHLANGHLPTFGGGGGHFANFPKKFYCNYICSRNNIDIYFNLSPLHKCFNITTDTDPPQKFNCFTLIHATMITQLRILYSLS